MPTKQGDIGLPNEPAAQSLLQSTHLARLAYVWPDGTPRVIPIWFHWNGKEIIIGTPVTAPKMRALGKPSQVALAIDTESWPHKILQIRGTARTQTIEGIVPEYAEAAERYFGADQG